MSKADKYFYKSQIDWILDDSPLAICEKGRQEGFSYAHSYKVTRRVAQKAARDEWVVSRDEVQAKQFILYVKRWANVLKYAAQDHGEQVFSDAGGKPVKVQVISFDSGATVYALSSNPDAIVGKTGHVTLDEFALHKDQRTLYAVAKPVTTWGGTLSVISTHRGVGTVFNQIVTDIKERGNKMGWSLHTVPVQKAVAEGLVEKLDRATGGSWTKRWEAARAETLGDRAGSSPSPRPSRRSSASQGRGRTASSDGKGDALRVETEAKTLREFWLATQRAECIDEEQWQQEYCCIPADESSAFISYEMIRGCEDDTSKRDFEYLKTCPNPLYIGMDVARVKDLAVIDVEEKVGDVFWERLRIEMQNKTYDEMEFELYRLLELPMMRRACIDASGNGEQLAERAARRFGYRVEGLKFTNTLKQTLAYPLRMAHEDRTLRYNHDARLQADLRGIKKDVTPSGMIRFQGDTDDSHCDRFWAKALALAAGKTPAVQFGSALI